MTTVRYCSETVLLTYINKSVTWKQEKDLSQR